MSRPRQLLLAFSLYGAVLVIAGCWDREPTAANNPAKPAENTTPTPSPEGPAVEPVPPSPDVSIQPLPTTDPLASNPAYMPVAPSPEGPAEPGSSPTAPATIDSPTGGQPNSSPMNPGANPPGTPAADNARPEERYGKNNPVDPIEANGPIFQDWPKPRLALVITGEQHGYLEPCGCAGLENMKGGLKRRMTFLNQLRSDGWPVVAVDLGDMVRRFGKQAEMKFHASMDALRTMKYDGVALGPTDLRLPSTELISDIGNPENGLVMANVGVFGFDSGLLPKYRIVDAGGIKVGITAVLGEKFRQQVASPDIETQPAAEALPGVLEKLGNQCQVLVLLSHGTVDEATALAKQFPQFNVVATAGGASLPPAEPGKVEGTNTWLIEVGQKGMYAGVIGYYGDDLKDRRFQRVPIDARFKDAEPILQQHIAFQDQLKQLGWAGLGVKASPHGSGREFVGSETCGQCHTKAYAIWKGTPHAHAMETLVKLNPPRQFDPECVSCHVTGWEPQKYFPFESGFTSLEATPHLAGNGCENCHGPGAKHADAELGNIDVSEAELAMLRDQMKLPLAKADEACRKCHDLDNSPDYVKNGFEAYWPAVEHKGKD